MVTRFTQKIKKKSSATRSDRNRTPFRALDAEFTTTDIDRMRSQWTNNSLFKKELTENVSDQISLEIDTACGLLRTNYLLVAGNSRLVADESA